MKTNYIAKWYGKILHIYEPAFKRDFYFVNAKTYNEYVGIVNKQLGLSLQRNNSNDNSGEFTTLSRTIDRITVPVGIFWCDKKDVQTVVHECFHAVKWLLLEQRDVSLVDNSEEIYAHTLDFLVWRILNTKREKKSVLRKKKHDKQTKN